MASLEGWKRIAVGALLLALLPPLAVAEADAIPAFARKYRVSCQLCHNPAPTLTEFGETFAGNGFRFAPNEPPRDTVDTNDPLLVLLEDLPLAVRADLYVQGFTNGDFATDLETPYNMKILSGGPLFKGVSYYFYFFLFERGEVGGVEDAFVYVNDIFGKPLDVQVGQFQVSDPMFKRELRLEFEDYAIYRARIGNVPQDLTYDRGIAVMWDVSRATVTGMAVNGNGRGEAEGNRRLDNNIPKDLLGHLSWPLLDNLRLGGMGYWGHHEVDPAGNRDDIWMAGADATIDIVGVEVNAQYIHREDDSATLSPGEPTVKTDGGFVEAIHRFADGRWYVLGLWNYIYCTAPLLDVRLGGPTGVNRHHTLTAGLGYLWQRNFRLLAEGGWDIEQEGTRWTIGLSAAF